MRQRFTLDEARHASHAELLERCAALLRPYEAEENETPEQLEARISKTLDELPDVYGWFQQLRGWFDHWTDFYMAQMGNKSLDYKAMRQKRDAMEHFASAAKLRYEGTSRRLTQIQGHQDEASMRRGR